MLLLCLNTQAEAWPNRYLCTKNNDGNNFCPVFFCVSATVRCLWFCWRVGSQKTAHSLDKNELILANVLLSVRASTWVNSFDFTEPCRGFARVQVGTQRWRATETETLWEGLNYSWGDLLKAFMITPQFPVTVCVTLATLYNRFATRSSKGAISPCKNLFPLFGHPFEAVFPWHRGVLRFHFEECLRLLNGNSFHQFL